MVEIVANNVVVSRRLTATHCNANRLCQKLNSETEGGGIHRFYALSSITETSLESVGEGGGLEEMKIELSLNWICRLLGAAWQYCLDLILMRLRVRRDGLHLVDK